MSDDKTKQPPAKRRKHASSVVGSRPNSKPTTARSTHEANQDASGSISNEDRKLDAIVSIEETKNWSVQDVCEYKETLFNEETSEISVQ